MLISPSYLRLMFLPILCLLTGCLISHGSETTHSGTHVAQGTFDQVNIGSTTAGWLSATLGSPNSVGKNDASEVWKYTYTEHTDEHGAIFLIFGGSDSSEKIETVFFELKDGVVITKWRG